MKGSGVQVEMGKTDGRHSSDPDFFQRHPVITTILVSVALVASVAIGVAILVGSGNQALAESKYQWPAFIGYAVLVVPLAILVRKNFAKFGLKWPEVWWPYLPIPIILLVHLIETDPFRGPPALQIILLLAIFGLLIGFVEEVLFRGILIRCFSTTWRAIMVSTLVFGLIHATRAFGATSSFETMLTIAFALVWGLFAATVYVSGGSIVPLIFMHWMWDWWALMDDTPQNNALLGTSTAIMLVWAVLLAFRLKRGNAVLLRVRN